MNLLTNGGSSRYKTTEYKQLSNSINNLPNRRSHNQYSWKTKCKYKGEEWPYVQEIGFKTLNDAITYT